MKIALDSGWQELPAGGVIAEPGTSAEYETGAWRTHYPLIDLQKCTHCLLCWVMCPDTAVRVKEGKVIGFDLRHCKGCGICATECPPKVKAITMTPGAPDSPDSLGVKPPDGGER